MKIEKETLQESRKCIPPLLIKGIIPFWAAPGTQNVRQNNLNPPLNHQLIPPKMPQTFSFLVAKIMDFWAAIYGLIPKFLIPSLFYPQHRGISGVGVCRDQTFLWNTFSRYGASAPCPSDHLATVGPGRSVGFPWRILWPWRGWRQGEGIFVVEGMI